MARQLQATHRWAVSGTPLGHGRLADVYGLTSFLGLGLGLGLGLALTLTLTLTP